MTEYIAAICKVCGTMFTHECKDDFFTDTPSRRWRCPNCAGKRGLNTKPKKKRNYTPEQIEAFKQRMKEHRERKI